MTRNDILGFVELLPVPDEDKVWDEVAGFLAKAVVERLSDLDPSTVLKALCGKDLRDENPPEDEEPADEDASEGNTPSSEEPADEGEEEPADEGKVAETSPSDLGKLPGSGY